jgi:hypothetical protein
MRREGDPRDELRSRLSLSPRAAARWLCTIATATQAVVDAMQDARNAGVDPARDPATILLARHVGRIALGHAPDETFAEDTALRRQCLARIDELKSKPALVALARRGIGYDPEAKRAFHREARSALRVAAAIWGLDPDQYDLRSNMPGLPSRARSRSTATRSTSRSRSPAFARAARSCSAAARAARTTSATAITSATSPSSPIPQSFRALVVRETGLSINPREQSLV